MSTDYTEEQVAILNAVRAERLVIKEQLTMYLTLFNSTDVSREKLQEVMARYLEVEFA